MNILIVGCGRLGSRLAETLDGRDGHDVAVIDIVRKKTLAVSAQNLAESPFLETPSICRCCAAPGLKAATPWRLATPDDNLNITVCQIAKKIFGIENAVARISDPAREEISLHFGAAVHLPHQLGL